MLSEKWTLQCGWGGGPRGRCNCESLCVDGMLCCLLGTMTASATRTAMRPAVKLLPVPEGPVVSA